MQVKVPFVPSTSAYNSPDVVWTDATNPPVTAVLCRASLGTPAWMGSITRAKDQVFPIYWRQWDRRQIPRGAYHFLKNEAGGMDQAKWFMQMVAEAGGWHPGDRWCLDVEDYQRPTSIKEILDFIYGVQLLAPPFLTLEKGLIYSREDIMDPLSFVKLTQAQRDYIRRVPQWPAGYPDDPDAVGFETLAHWYQYNRDKYGPCVLVQYAASAVVEGLSKPGFLSIECNVAQQAWLDEWVRETQAHYGTAPQPVRRISHLEVPMSDGTTRRFIPEE